MNNWVNERKIFSVLKISFLQEVQHNLFSGGIFSEINFNTFYWKKSTKLNTQANEKIKNINKSFYRLKYKISSLVDEKFLFL